MVAGDREVIDLENVIGQAANGDDPPLGDRELFQDVLLEF
jgi:hypothetical protein